MWSTIQRGLCVAIAGLASLTALAGELDRTALESLFPSPYEIAERELDLPVWPLLRRNGPYLEQVGYLFESIDLAPLPGFAGIPINVLVAINNEGEFVDARVVSQHEPVFLDGLGPEPMHAFARQYPGLSLHQNIKVLTSIDGSRRAGSTNAYIDGVSKATASVRIMNESILNAALAVARARMGVGPGGHAARGRIHDPRPAVYTWPQLLDRGLVRHLSLSNAAVESAFADSDGAGLDPQALADPQALFVDAYAAWFNLASVALSLFEPTQAAAIRSELQPGDLALLLFSRGRYGVVAEDFVPHSVPDRLSLRQHGFPIGLRDMDRDERARAVGMPDFAQAFLFRVPAAAGLDPTQALQLRLRVSRYKGYLLPREFSRDFDLAFAVPPAYRVAAEVDDSPSGWWLVLHERRADLWLLVAALLGLGLVLAWPGAVAVDARRLARFRTVWLLFCLGYIGWYGQGQLSIVNLTAVIQAVGRDAGLGFMLHDPMTLCLWLFVGVSLLAWGRGTFCGWLCPFGALQELLARAGRRVGVPAVQLPAAWDRRLLGLKYLVLVGLLLAAGFSPMLADRLVEVEPFKTAITLGFARDWPYVAYALLVLGASMIVFKSFCRYLCPLGAALAVMGRLRLLNWIPRRAACGTRCQLCRRSCEYQAIAESGRIDYAECFQCLDCVGIYHDRERCAPLLLEDRKGVVLVHLQPDRSPARG